MGMEFFKKKRRISAIMKGAKGRGKRMKSGSGREGARKKMIMFQFEIPITAKIRELLDPKIQGLISLDGSKEGADREFPINSIDPTRQVFPAIIAAYSKGNHRGDEVEWTQGGAEKDQQATICLKKIAIKDNCAIMALEVETFFTKQIWGWAGDMLDDGEFVLAFEPLQGELFTEKDKDTEGGGDADDPRPASLKNKEKEKAEAKE